MDKYITTPITAETTKGLRAGDYVYITGTLYVARDAAHKRLIEALEKEEREFYAQLPKRDQNNGASFSCRGGSHIVNGRIYNWKWKSLP